jgi:Fic family protein
MQASEFQGDTNGELIRNMEGQLTFLPYPLPGPLALDLELLGVLNVAERALGRLIGVGQTLPNPQIVIKSFIRREAQLSSRIENTHAQLSDLVLFEQTQAVEKRVPDVREVHNNELALAYGLESVQHRGREIGVPLVKEMTTC